jgi:hypothetical protein
MARSIEDLGEVGRDANWDRLAPTPGARVWTDDYSNIVSALKFGPLANSDR